MSIDQAVSAPATTPTVTVTAPAPIKAFDQDDGPSFHDVLDIVNPLQHIPIINTLYRHLTGDEEGAVADVGGGALWMGPVGLVGALADLAVKSETGKSIGDNILSWLGLDDEDDTAKTAEAQTQQQVQQQAQQVAAVTAPLPAITAQALAPLPARGNDRKDDRRDAAKDNGPVRAGDFMVFGAAGSGQPQSPAPTPLTPQPVTQQPAAQQAEAGPSRQGNYMVFGGSSQQSNQQQPQQQAPAATIAADTPSVGHQGQYMVFGTQTAPSAPTAQAAQAAAAYAAPMQMTPASASVTPRTPLPSFESAPTNTAAVQAAAVAASVPAGGGPAALSPMPARSFAPPARRSQVTPNALPMPTTGPGAVPGRATSTQALPAMSQQDTSWFAQAVNAGLDKYAAAQKLANQDNLAASATAGAESANTIH